MSDPESHAANWYPDPMGRHEYRYFDGTNWTEHVTSHGRQPVDPLNAPTHVPQRDVGVDKIQQDLEKKLGVQPGQVQGGGTVFTEPILVVNQKAKVIEVNNEYAISDQQGTQIGAVRQVGQSKAKKAMRMLTPADQFMTHKLQVVDMEGRVLLAITRPAKFVKSKVIVQDGSGTEIGQVVQDNVFGKIHFSLMSGGHTHGSINAENWRAWNFSIRDHTDAEVARITKTFSGLTRAVFTTADNYLVQFHRPLDDPLRSLVVASSVSVDTALKQDARGLG
jgi:uncharacterized protein YxjI